jgi:Fungal specific transcription factor domain/Fungal Zn(2)-Cys(6) binuclear cluster domain
MSVQSVIRLLDGRNTLSDILLHTRDLDHGFVNTVVVDSHESMLPLEMQWIDFRDVMYRHHNTCQAAHDAGYRRGTVPKKSKRRSCERCSRLKCKCDDQSPCGRCAAAGVECHRSPNKTPQMMDDEELTGIHLLAHHAAQTPKEVLSPAVISPEFFSNSVSTSQQMQFSDPFQQDTSATLTSNETVFDWGLFDTNIGSMDSILPDTDELLREMFKTLNHPQTNSLQVDSGAILPDPTVDEQLCDWNSVSIAMNKIDPLEAHRLTINQHLLRSGNVSKEDIVWLSPHNVREMVYCYFRHFHRHAPIIHLPTWDIATTPSSLLLTLILLGAVYSDNPEKHAPHARRLVPEAKSLIHKLDQVSSS